jgi:site-specific DNA recombinase
MAILDQLAKFERAKTVERSRRGKKQKARLGKILSTRAAYGFDWNSARDGYVINPEQMAVLRRMFYMVGVEGRSLCSIQKQLSEDGVLSPTGKAQWDLQSIRKLLKRDLYRPHTYLEMREIVGPDVLARLDPGSKYGVYWFGERAETRKRVSDSGEGGRVYKHRYTSKVRPVADRIGVPVPDSGIPREWVEAARANLEENRRPANAGRRFWDLSAGILRCSECGLAMSPRTTSRTYYYACTVGPSKRLDSCFARKFHSAAELEERVWSVVSAILTDPEKLRTGLDEMVQRERAKMLGDPLKEAATLGKRLQEIKSRRSRYQEMAAAKLIDFDELRERLGGLEDERKDTERALQATQRRAEHLEHLEQNRNVLLQEYAGAVPEVLDALAPEERHRVYRIMRLRVVLAPSGDLEISGDVMPTSVCRTETPYLLD